MRPLPTVISFFTPNWEYPQHAHRLRQECDQLGLRHRIESRPTTGRYGANCCLKPGFIDDCMAVETGPLLWVDVDASILHLPVYFQNIAESYHVSAKQRADTSDLVWHVGTIWFDVSDLTREFVRHWKSTGTSTDERSFNMTAAKMKTQVNIADMPPQYFQILHPRQQIMPDTVIMHRISKSPEKLAEKRCNKS